MRVKEPECVRIQHEGGRRVYEATKDLTHEELLAWWEERNKAFRKLVDERRPRRRQA
jgi:hypothetical protein